MSDGAQDLPMEARLEAHALLDRLTMDGSTFSREDATRLITLIPVTPRRRFSFTGLFQGRGPGFRGRASPAKSQHGDRQSRSQTRDRSVPWPKWHSFRNRHTRSACHQATRKSERVFP